MATITVTVPDTIMIGRNGAHGSLQVEWEKVPQHVKDHIAAVHFPQYFSDSFNSGGKEATSADRLALAEKKYAQMLAGEIRTRGASLEPVDPTEREAYSEARKALAAYFVNQGLWKDIPKGTTNRFEYVLNKAQKLLGDPETTDVDYIAWFLDETDVGRQIRKDAEATVIKRERLATGLLGLVKHGLVKRDDAKPVATKRGKAA